MATPLAHAVAQAEEFIMDGDPALHRSDPDFTPICADRRHSRPGGWSLGRTARLQRISGVSGPRNARTSSTNRARPGSVSDTRDSELSSGTNRALRDVCRRAAARSRTGPSRRRARAAPASAPGLPRLPRRTCDHVRRFSNTQRALQRDRLREIDWNHWCCSGVPSGKEQRAEHLPERRIVTRPSRRESGSGVARPLQVLLRRRVPVPPAYRVAAVTARACPRARDDEPRTRSRPRTPARSRSSEKRSSRSASTTASRSPTHDSNDKSFAS